MPVKTPQMPPPPNTATEEEIMALIERGGSPPATPSKQPKTVESNRKIASQEVESDLKMASAKPAPAEKTKREGKKRGPKPGSARAASREGGTRRHTLYVPEELYELLLSYQQKQRRPWPSLNYLIVQAVYELVEREEAATQK